MVFLNIGAVVFGRMIKWILIDYDNLVGKSGMVF